jgi:hypothetical protein
MNTKFSKELLESLDTNTLRQMMAMGYRGSTYNQIRKVYMDKMIESTLRARGFNE